MAGYKKKRARQLKHDRFRDTTMSMVDRLADRLEGKGRLILYGLVGLLVAFVLIYAGIGWQNRRTQEAEQAMGRAIKIASAEISLAPPPDSKDLSFNTEEQRAQRAIEEFRKVEAKYGEPYRSQARYFSAVNLLIVDRGKGISELTTLQSSSNREVNTLAKFALAQAYAEDKNFEDAAGIYAELAKQNDAVVTPETANLCLAQVYDRQGKKKEAADLLFNTVETARKAKDPEGKPAPQSSAVRKAAQELQRIDAARYAQLTPEIQTTQLPFGG